MFESIQQIFPPDHVSRRIFHVNVHTFFSAEISTCRRPRLRIQNHRWNSRRGPAVYKGMEAFSPGAFQMEMFTGNNHSQPKSLNFLYFSQKHLCVADHQYGRGTLCGPNVNLISRLISKVLES